MNTTTLKKRKSESDPNPRPNKTHKVNPCCKAVIEENHKRLLTIFNDVTEIRREFKNLMAAFDLWKGMLALKEALSDPSTLIYYQSSRMELFKIPNRFITKEMRFDIELASLHSNTHPPSSKSNKKMIKAAIERVEHLRASGQYLQKGPEILGEITHVYFLKKLV